MTGKLVCLFRRLSRPQARRRTIVFLRQRLERTESAGDDWAADHPGGLQILLSLIATHSGRGFCLSHGHLEHLRFQGDFERVLVTLLLSTVWWRRHRHGLVALRNQTPEKERKAILSNAPADIFSLLKDKFLIDELYGATIVRWNALCARVSDGLDRLFVWAPGSGVLTW